MTTASRPRGAPRSAAATILACMQLASLIAIACHAQSPPIERTYTIDPSPGVEILAAKYGGGVRTDHPVYRLFGDGTFRAQTYAYEFLEGRGAFGYSRPPIEDLVVKLSQDELREILDPLIAAGVMELNWAEKSEALRAQGRGVAAGSVHTGGFIVQITLPSYVGPASPSGGPFRHIAVLTAYHYAREQLADIPEVAALGHLEERLRELAIEARAKRER